MSTVPNWTTAVKTKKCAGFRKKSISAAVRLEGHACVCTCLCMHACVSGVCLYHAVALRWTALRWWITHYGDWFCLLPAIALPVEYEQPALLQPLSLTYTVQMMGRINWTEKMEEEHFGRGARYLKDWITDSTNKNADFFTCRKIIWLTIYGQMVVE